jgi:EDD domain protein, DegV family
MNEIKIIADSGSDLPPGFFQNHDITLVPLRVHLDGKEYEDLVTITPETLYRAMKEGKVPKTSQASPELFRRLFIRLALEKRPAIYIAFSSALSGTYQTAVMIREQVLESHPDLDVTIIDSRSASLGLGLAVMRAAEWAKSGMPKEHLVEQIKSFCRHLEHLFTVDDLEYLKRGGRISRASAVVGNLLSIKPLLSMEDGKLVLLEKCRGRKKLFHRIVERIRENGESLDRQTIAISHADAWDSALELKNLLEEKLDCRKFYINSIGAVIGSHVGPGTLAVFFLKKDIEFVDAFFNNRSCSFARNFPG